MDLIVFDLDGTLLNASSEISSYTQETLERLSARGIAYTVATGRALHASRSILRGHGFRLPQAYKNGVLIWNPTEEDYSHHNFLTLPEIQHVVEAVMRQKVTPFMFTLEPGNVHAVYHPPLQNDVEERLAADFRARSGVSVFPASRMPLTKLSNFWVSFNESPIVGSSRMMMSASKYKARTIATPCLSPPENVPTRESGVTAAEVKPIDWVIRRWVSCFICLTSSKP